MKSLKEFITENLENKTIEENQEQVVENTSEKTAADNANKEIE